VRRWTLLLACALLLATCCPPGSVKTTVKLGLSAPFEGRYRDLGYEVLYAVRLAVRQRNEAGGVADGYLVEMVALNDFNAAEEAVEQARKMAVDPDVLAVLGGWSPETAAAAGPVYEQLGLAFVAPPAGFAAHGPVDPAFVAAYEALSGGVSPGPAGTWAYQQAQRMLDAYAAAIVSQGEPSRAAVRSRLAQSD
jgi:ABC-type branched-subunit amino acid transport system substrate-binding protein